MEFQNEKCRFCVNVYCDEHVDLIASIRQQLQLLGTDFKIIVDQQVFTVHKLILAMHSACIAALISYGHNSPDHTETILDGLAASHFRTILDWMYNGHIVLRCSNVIALYAAAIKYDIPKLVTLCQQFMIENEAKSAPVSERPPPLGKSEEYASRSDDSSKDRKPSPVHFEQIISAPSPPEEHEPVRETGIEHVRTETTGDTVYSSQNVPDVEEAGEGLLVTPAKADLTILPPDEDTMISMDSSDSSSRIFIREISSTRSLDDLQRTLSSRQLASAIPLGANILKVTTRINGDTYKQETETTFANDGKTVIAMDRCTDQDLTNVSSVITRRIMPKLTSGSMAIILETDIRCPGFDGEDGVIMSMEVSVDPRLLSIRGYDGSDSGSVDSQARKPPEEAKVWVTGDRGEKRSVYVTQDSPGRSGVARSIKKQDSSGKVEEWLESAKGGSDLLEGDGGYSANCDGNRQGKTIKSSRCRACSDGTVVDNGQSNEIAKRSASISIQRGTWKP